MRCVGCDCATLYATELDLEILEDSLDVIQLAIIQNENRGYVCQAEYLYAESRSAPYESSNPHLFCSPRGSSFFGAWAASVGP